MGFADCSLDGGIRTDRKAPALKSEAAAPAPPPEKEPEAEINKAPAFMAQARAPEPEKMPPVVHTAKVPELEIGEGAARFRLRHRASDAAFLETPLVKAETEAGASLSSKAAGWIESVFPAKYPKGGWFSSLRGSAPKTDAADTSEPAEIPAATFQAEEEISATSVWSLLQAPSLDQVLCRPLPGTLLGHFY